MAVRTKAKATKNGTEKAVQEEANIDRLLAEDDLGLLDEVEADGDAVADYLVRQAGGALSRYRSGLIQKLIREHGGRETEGSDPEEVNNQLEEVKGYLDAVRAEYDDVVKTFKVDPKRVPFPEIEPTEAEKLELALSYKKLMASTFEARRRDYAIARRMHEKSKKKSEDESQGMKQAREAAGKVCQDLEDCAGYIEHLEKTMVPAGGKDDKLAG